MITLKFQNEKAAVAAFMLSPTIMASEMQKAMTQASMVYVREVKNDLRSGNYPFRRPYQTGTMSRNVGIESQTPMRVIVSPNYSITPYAEYVILGTGTHTKYGSRPFLDVTAEHSKEFIEECFAKAMENVIANVSSKM